MSCKNLATLEDEDLRQNLDCNAICKRLREKHHQLGERFPIQEFAQEAHTKWFGSKLTKHFAHHAACFCNIGKLGVPKLSLSRCCCCRRGCVIFISMNESHWIVFKQKSKVRIALLCVNFCTVLNGKPERISLLLSLFLCSQFVVMMQFLASSQTESVRLVSRRILASKLTD